MTRRERLQARAERRREWAEGRRDKAASLLKANEPYRGDVAFNTQPGHIPERARAIARSERAYEHESMAQHHIGRAVGIEQQLERTIFSDDPDAVEALEAKAAALEAEADRLKAVNAAYRKAPGADSAAKLAALVNAGTLTRGKADAIALMFGGCPGERQPYPSYMLTNRRANARRLRERIKEVKARQQKAAEADAAGGIVVKIHASGYASVTFAERPDRPTLDDLKAAGFHYSGGTWYGKADSVPASVTRQASEAKP